MEVVTRRDGGEYYIKFEDGGKVAVPLKKVGTTNRRELLLNLNLILLYFRQQHLVFLLYVRECKRVLF